MATPRALRQRQRARQRRQEAVLSRAGTAESPKRRDNATTALTEEQCEDRTFVGISPELSASAALPILQADAREAIIDEMLALALNKSGHVEAKDQIAAAKFILGAGKQSVDNAVKLEKYVAKSAAAAPRVNQETDVIDGQATERGGVDFSSIAAGLGVTIIS